MAKKISKNNDFEDSNENNGKDDLEDQIEKINFPNNYILEKLISKIPKDYSKRYISPKSPDIIDPSDDGGEQREKRETRKKPIDRREVLSPLDGVFFDDNLMDDLIVRTSIPQLLEGKLPEYPGVILFGPPGTGKSEFQKAVCGVYENAGAYAKQVSTSEVNSCFVGQLAKNLERELLVANQQGEIRGLPSFLSFDEGSILAQQADLGSSNVSKHYQEAIDTLKRYLGNDCGKHLVLAISTNMLPEDFEEAMTREGRLTSFFIPYPSQTQIGRMWEYFANKYGVLKLNEDNIKELSELTQDVRGAFIEQFCRGYLNLRRQNLLVSKGFRGMLDALKSGEYVRDEEVRKTINYEQFRNDIVETIKSSLERNGVKKEKGRIGFVRE